MHIHSLQHHAIETLGIVRAWAQERGDEITSTRLDLGDALPVSLEHLDLLVVMGGPMNIYQHRDYPWLLEEKRFIRRAIQSGKRVLGICLGAQLLADALGARVYQNEHREIGWFPIIPEPGAAKWLPSEVTVLHWHGDTFDLPAGATPFGYSAACRNQGFVYNDRVVAIQCHLEVDADMTQNFTRTFSAELTPSVFVQSASEILDGARHRHGANAALIHILDRLAGIGEEGT